MNLGEMTAFIAYLGILIWPMIAIGWVMNIVQQAEASMKRVLESIEDAVEAASLKNIKKLLDGFNSLEVTIK